MKNEQTKQTRMPAVFFDGTGNNQTNSLNDPAKFGNITNISKLLDACVVPDRVYIEGVGTRNNMDDSVWAKATGENPIGSNGYSYGDKLEKATGFLSAYRAQYPDDDIQLVIYGFSRGATLARDFAKKALAFPNVSIKFLGIYDTVVSLLFQSPKIHFTTQEMEKIDQILHLTAINEARGYFPLTSIQVKNGGSELVTIQNKVDGNKVKEIFVPGAHADVGGGYTAGAEKLYLNGAMKNPDDLMVDWEIIQNTVRDHFENDAQNRIWKSLVGSNVTIEGTDTSANMLTRRDQVAIDMSYVYFEVMASYSNTFSNSTIFDFTPSAFSADLAKLKNDILQYIQSGTPDKGPNYDYAKLAYSTHISSNYGKLSSQVDNNQMLNTFDYEALKDEIERIKNEHPNENFESFNVDVIATGFNIDLIHVNAPNTKEWHRKVIYG
ncbi:T6SS phospholipase effector Tle1-like catalytic domain-containing protein [Myroides odoratus]